MVQTSKFTPQTAENPRQAFCPALPSGSVSTTSTDVYSLQEIAFAAGAPEARVRILIEGQLALSGTKTCPAFFSHRDAVRIGRAVRAPAPLFALVSSPTATGQSKGVPLALSSTLHGGILSALVFVTTLGITPSATTLPGDDRPADRMRLVFLATPGPGGGGGGGGLLQKAPPPKALREGRHSMSSPIPRRDPPRPIVPAPAPPEPKPEPPLRSEPLPVVVAPIVTAPADGRDRIGILVETPAATDSHGPGKGGGTGTGTDTGLGEGDGSGVGPGLGWRHRRGTVQARQRHRAAQGAARSQGGLHRRGAAARGDG